MDGLGLTPGGAADNGGEGSVVVTWTVDSGCAGVPPQPAAIVTAPRFTG